jgi:hypothetical protein
VSPQNILYFTWAGIFIIGFIAIAIRKSAQRRPSKGLSTSSNPFASRPPQAPREIDLAREVQRIRRILFSIWWLIFFLGIFIMASWPKGFISVPITP